MKDEKEVERRTRKDVCINIICFTNIIFAKGVFERGAFRHWLDERTATSVRRGSAGEAMQKKARYSIRHTITTTPTNFLC